MTEQSKELAILQENNVLDVVQENLGGAGINEWELDRIKIPAGGAQAWTVPGLSGEEMVKSLEGVIVAWRDTRAYWKGDFAGAGEAPDCTSPDAVQGYGDPGVKCAECPHAQWGSGKGGSGQACKLTRQLYFLRGSSLLPEVVVLAPTSIPPVRKYFQRLTGEGVPYFGVLTRLSLEKRKSGGGIDYSRVVPEMVRPLDSDEIAKIKQYADALEIQFSLTPHAEEGEDG